MWFKNLIVFPISQTDLPDDDALEAALSQTAFQPCSQQQQVSMGFTPPIGQTSGYSFRQGDNILMSVKRQERLLPGSVISETLAEKVEQIETNESRKVGRNERQTLKDEVTFELLPKAFTRTQQHWLYLDRDNGWIVLGVGSSTRAEELLSLLRDTLGSLPAVPLASKLAVNQLLRDSFIGENGELLAGLDEFELRQPGDPETITRHKHHELAYDDAIALLDNDWQVTKLSCNWRDRLQFVLDKDGLIKRLKFSDTVLDQQDPQDDDAQQAAADFMLQTGEINQLLKDLFELSS